MTRHRQPKKAASFELFPFLAVLLCTMGSLILMLVVITRNARDRDLERRQASAEVHEDLEVKVSTAQWRNEQLLASGAKSAEQLAESRLELSHLEDHGRRIRDEIGQIEDQLAALAAPTDTSASLDALRAKLAEIEAKIRSRQETLDKTIHDVNSRQPSYAIIPHDGPNQTRRRPMYIECLAESVVLQPEGIVLRESDFLGALGPGNALAAALRAGREHLARTRSASPTEDDGEPYPLLLVRPSGIGAYYAAREAMTSWGAEFGYEFVDQDWQLKYLPIDDGLAMAMNRAVEEARRRQVALAMAAPRLMTAEERLVFSRSQGGPNSSGGGFGLGGGSGATSGRGASGGTADRAAGYSSRGQGAGDGLMPAGAGPDGGGAAGGAGQSIPHSSARASSADLAEIYGGVAGGPGGPGGAPGGTGSQMSNAQNGPSAVASLDGRRGTGGGNDAQGDPSALAGKQTGEGSGTRGPDNSGKQQGDDSGTGSGEGAGKTVSSGGAKGGRGSANATGSGSAASGSSSTSSSQTSGSTGAPSALASNNGMLSLNATKDNSQPPQGDLNIAASRGANWALSQESRKSGAVFVTRPLQIECHADRLVLRSERGDTSTDQTVRIEGDPVVAIDALVVRIWKHVDSWGIAGRGMDWRPVLFVHVSVDGRGRFEELKTMLDGSGLEVREATALSSAAPSPIPPHATAQATPTLVRP